MKIIIAGATGFIGQAMVQRYLGKGYQCVVIGRDEKKIKKIFSKNVKIISWEQFDKKISHEIKTADLIINLAGANIGDARWSEKRKQEILNSRVVTTKTLARYCAALGKNSPPLFNASAVGIYGLQAEIKNGLPPAFDEQSIIDCAHPQCFLSTVGCEWESATKFAKEAGVRVVNMRFGVVLGKHGGVLKKLKLPFLFFLGGPVGTGQQAFSWIALDDLLNAIDFVYEQSEISGPVNFVAPNCVTQQQLAKAMGKILHRPSFMPTPAFTLKLIFGQMAEELLLNGQHAVPGVLQKAGFRFQYPDIKSALQISLV